VHNQNSKSLDRREEELERAYDLFARRVAPSVIEALQDPSAFKLGGNETTAAVIVTDMRDYATMAHEHDISAVVEMLNEYYQIVVDATLSNLGLLDKFMGDRCLLFFNAPIADPDFLERSVQAALQIKAGIEELSQRHANSALYPLSVGIGLTVGTVWIGTVGAEQLVGYTIIGETVNTAFRLAKLPRETRVLTVESVIEALGSEAKTGVSSYADLPDEPRVRVYELLHV
jgi:adenylate cyclase